MNSSDVLDRDEPSDKLTGDSFGAEKPKYEADGIVAEEKHVLIVEDEKMLRNLLIKTLQKVGYQVMTANDGQSALEVVAKNPVDLIILDIMMPKMDGFAFCEAVRRTSDVPIMMLTALNRPDDVVRGLQLGADEYVTKPFSFNELNIRIHSLLRRSSWTKGSAPLAYSTGDGPSLNDKSETAYIRGKEVQLTPMEYRFLRYLMTHPNCPISNETLLSEVWNYQEGTNTSIVQSIVRRIRMKIEETPSNPTYLVSVWGIGYKFQLQEETDK